MTSTSTIAALRVECRDTASGEVPVRFGTARYAQEVAEVIDRWPGEGYCYFRVRARDGAIFILRHDEREKRWQISVFESGAAGLRESSLRGR